MPPRWRRYVVHPISGHYTRSSQNPVPFILEAWVVADRPVAAPAAPSQSLPPGFWQNYQRQTTRLLSSSLSLVPLHH